MFLDKNNLNKILIINLGGIGDILLSTPALSALKNKFPKAQISMLVVPRVYELVKDSCYIDNSFLFHKRNSLISFLRNLITLFILRKMHFDLAINMRTIVSQRSASKIKFLLDSINPKVKAGRDTDGRAKFLDIKIPETLIGQKYEMDYDIEMARVLGAEAMDRSIDFEIDEKSVKEVDRILEEEGAAKDSILIGIHPGGWSSRRWPEENFSKAADGIAEKISCTIVITGAKNEAGLAGKLIKISRAKAINLTGKLSIKELEALIKRCRLYISNDTGPMHIAAGLKTPLVAIFGAGDLVRYDPRNISDKAIVLYKKMDCAPCNKMKCETLRCLRAISAEEVVEAALHFLR